MIIDKTQPGWQTSLKAFLRDDTDGRFFLEDTIDEFLRKGELRYLNDVLSEEYDKGFEAGEEHAIESGESDFQHDYDCPCECDG